MFKNPNGLVGILFAEKYNHARYRRLFGPSFSEKGMMEQESVVLGYVDALMRGLGKESESGEVDISKRFNVCLPLDCSLDPRLR